MLLLTQTKANLKRKNACFGKLLPIKGRSLVIKDKGTMAVKNSLKSMLMKHKMITSLKGAKTSK